MNIIQKRITVIVLILILFAVSGLVIAKSIYNNRMPKSAKLVLHLENNSLITGKNKIVTSHKGGKFL